MNERETSPSDARREVRDDMKVLLGDIAERLIEVAAQAIEARGQFTFVLAGGSTPKVLYELLASDQYRARIDWTRTVVLFGDERAVSPDDEQSNYRMARESLFDLVPLPAHNIHRMRGELSDLNAAAKEYGLLVQELGTTLDVCLLGMGDDGHTASLFPHSPQLDEARHRCVATPIASHAPHVARLTLTYRTFNAARHIWIIVTGEAKAARLAQVVEGARDFHALPIQNIAPSAGELIWWLDDKAAKSLTSK